jgi:hypothetical protein
METAVRTLRWDIPKVTKGWTGTYLVMDRFALHMVPMGKNSSTTYVQGLMVFLKSKVNANKPTKGREIQK